MTVWMGAMPRKKKELEQTSSQTAVKTVGTESSATAMERIYNKGNYYTLEANIADRRSSLDGFRYTLCDVAYLVEEVNNARGEAMLAPLNDLVCVFFLEYSKLLPPRPFGFDKLSKTGNLYFNILLETFDDVLEYLRSKVIESESKLSRDAVNQAIYEIEHVGDMMDAAQQEESDVGLRSNDKDIVNGATVDNVRNHDIPEDKARQATEQNIKDHLQELTGLMSSVDAFRANLIPQVCRSLNKYLNAIANEQILRKDGDNSKFVDNIDHESKKAIVDLVALFSEKLGLKLVLGNKECRFVVAGGTAKGRFQLIPKGSDTAILSRTKLVDLLPLSLMDNQVIADSWVQKEEVRKTVKTDIKVG